MRTSSRLRASGLVVLAGLVFGLSITQRVHAETGGRAAVSSRINPRLLRRFVPLRARFDAPSEPASEPAIRLGRMLFYDARLSADRDVSCNSCHRLDHYGVDGKRFSIGTRGQLGRRNSPTVFNAAGHFQQFWDGRSGDVEEQATGPMMNPREMAMPGKAEIEQRLRAIPGYVAAFKEAFPGQSSPVTIENIATAIGAFERGLSTPSRWDRFLLNDTAALTADEIEGFKIFSNVGCMVCHTGELLGGSTFQRLGLVEPWPNSADQGRFEITHANADKMIFKVPSLRNVARTAPYFHDASAPTLETAVKMMGRHQLGLDLGDDEVAAIIKWLGTLTGDVDPRYTAKPELPPNLPAHSGI